MQLLQVTAIISCCYLQIWQLPVETGRDSQGWIDVDVDVDSLDWRACVNRTLGVTCLLLQLMDSLWAFERVDEASMAMNQGHRWRWTQSYRGNTCPTVAWWWSQRTKDACLSARILFDLVAVLNNDIDIVKVGRIVFDGSIIRITRDSSVLFVE